MKLSSALIPFAMCANFACAQVSGAPLLNSNGINGCFKAMNYSMNNGEGTINEAEGVKCHLLAGDRIRYEIGANLTKVKSGMSVEAWTNEERIEVHDWTHITDSSQQLTITYIYRGAEPYSLDALQINGDWDISLTVTTHPDDKATALRDAFVAAGAEKQATPSIGIVTYTLHHASPDIIPDPIYNLGRAASEAGSDANNRFVRLQANKLR